MESNRGGGGPPVAQLDFITPTGRLFPAQHSPSQSTEKSQSSASSSYFLSGLDPASEDYRDVMFLFLFARLEWGEPPEFSAGI